MDLEGCDDGSFHVVRLWLLRVVDVDWEASAWYLEDGRIVEELGEFGGVQSRT